jgi:probable rRNA maturation factor
MTPLRKTEKDITRDQITVDTQIESPQWKALTPSLISHVKDAVREAILEVGFPEPCEVCVLLTTNAEVKTLNNDFRRQDKATNVLSFPGLELHELRVILKGGAESDPDGDPIYLGDMALAYETIAQEAQEQNKNLLNHLTHLLIHGTLHLLGYDHMNEKEAQTMEALEAKILKNKFNIDNPYLNEEK